MSSKLSQLNWELRNLRSYKFENNKKKQTLIDRKNNIQKNMSTFSSQIEFRNICKEIDAIEKKQILLLENEKKLLSQIKQCTLGCRETSRLLKSI
jgi:uroporphyrinogen-III synthase